MRQLLELYNELTDHVMLQSELKYFIGVIEMRIKGHVFGGKTGQFATVLMFVW